MKKSLLFSLILLISLSLFPKQTNEYYKVNKLLNKFNSYWKVAEEKDANSIHLFDAFNVYGKKFNFKNIINKKIIIIIFSDDLHLKLTSFWINRDNEFISTHYSNIYFINILQPTRIYYTLYKNGYEKALRKHIDDMKKIFYKKIGRRLKKNFLKIPVQWIFDYRLEISKTYRMINKQGVFIFDKQGKLIIKFTGTEKNFIQNFRKTIIKLLRFYGNYVEEKN